MPLLPGHFIFHSHSSSKSLHCFSVNRSPAFAPGPCLPTISPCSTAHAASPDGFQPCRVLPSQSETHLPGAASTAPGIVIRNARRCNLLFIKLPTRPDGVLRLHYIGICAER